MTAAAAYGAYPPSVEDASFTAKCDNSKQNYLVVYPKDFKGDEPHHVLILLHGHGSDRRQILDESVHEFRAGRDAAAAHEHAGCLARLSRQNFVDGAEGGGRSGADSSTS